MESIHEIMIEQLKLKKLFERTKINYLTNEDRDVCNYVVNNLSNINVGSVDNGIIIDKNEMVEIGTKELIVFGDDIFVRAMSIASKTSIISDDVHSLSTLFSYEFDNSNNIDKNSGKVAGFIVPKNIYEILGYFYGHEQIHAMKDTNYLEWVNVKRFGEVIPIFYELIINNPDNIIKNNLLKIRMSNTLDNTFQYTVFNYGLSDNRVDKWIGIENCEQEHRIEFYEFQILQIGSYLNGFYYALILYNMYKEDSKKILNLVSKVLKHEMTTLEMLLQLGIYGDIRGSVFEKEITNIKKLLK